MPAKISTVKEFKAAILISFAWIFLIFSEILLNRLTSYWLVPNILTILCAAIASSDAMINSPFAFCEIVPAALSLGDIILR